MACIAQQERNLKQQNKLVNRSVLDLLTMN
jgi:hypothetical protein